MNPNGDQSKQIAGPGCHSEEPGHREACVSGDTGAGTRKKTAVALWGGQGQEGQKAEGLFPAAGRPLKARPEDSHGTAAPKPVQGPGGEDAAAGRGHRAVPSNGGTAWESGVGLGGRPPAGDPVPSGWLLVALDTAQLRRGGLRSARHPTPSL